MNDYERQKEHYDKAMKNLIEAGKDFQELTPQNKEKFAEQVLGMYGMTGIIKMNKVCFMQIHKKENPKYEIRFCNRQSTISG